MIYLALLWRESSQRSDGDEAVKFRHLDDDARELQERERDVLEKDVLLLLLLLLRSTTRLLRPLLFGSHNSAPATLIGPEGQLYDTT